MSDYIDETSLTDEEVAAAIAQARAKKAAKTKKTSLEEDDGEFEAPIIGPDIDVESSDDLLNESSAAAMDEDEDSPAVKSAKDFSNAFAAAKKKREQDLLKKKEEHQTEDDDDESDDGYAPAIAIDDDDEDAEFDTDEEVDAGDEDAEYEYEEDEEDEEDEEYEEDEEEFDNDGIFETDDEGSEYNTAAVIDDEDEDEDEDDGDDEDDDEKDDDENDSAFSTKTKVIIGIIIALLVVAIIAAGAYFMKNTGSTEKPGNTTSAAQSSEVKSVRFEESSVTLQVGQSIPLKLIVEPADTKDKSFKLKSNDMSIAKVNEKCEVIGVSSGSTTITATLKSNPTMTAAIVVNVIDEEQSTLNTYNKFVNSILDGSTDIDIALDTDTDENIDENMDTDSEASSDSDSDTDTRGEKKATHTLTGNKMVDLDSDGSLELALYYQPNAEDGEPLVRIFHMVSEDDSTAAADEETDSEPEQLYDEFGNPIEAEQTDTEAESESETESKAETDTAAENKEPAEKKLEEIDQASELYATCRSALESNAAGDSWNTSFIELKEGNQADAKVQILSKGYTTPTYTFESEDNKVATVDKQGHIKGVKPGTVFITVSTPLNSEAVAKIKVKIKDDTDLLDDYLAAIPSVDNTNDSVFPTQTLTGKAIIDIDNDGMSELLVRLRYSDNVEVVNIVKVENEKCVVYKTYKNLSDLYEYSEGKSSYRNAILIHYTTGKVCIESKATSEKDGSSTKSTEERILTLENGGTLSEMVNFRTVTETTTKTVTSEVDTTSSRVETDVDTADTDSDEFYDDTDSEEITTPSDGDDDTDEDNTSYVDEDNDGYDDITGEYFGSGTFAEFDFDNASDSIDLTANNPVKKLPLEVGAPDDDDDDADDADTTTTSDDNDNNDTSTQDNNEDTTSTVTTEVTEEETKYFVNGTAVEKGVYEEVITQYTATYSVWNAWDMV